MPLANGPCASCSNELTERGLTTRPGPHTPAKKLSLNGLCKLLANPYYIGEVTYAASTTRASTPL